jgi:hypothetical protein
MVLRDRKREMNLVNLVTFSGKLSFFRRKTWEVGSSAEDMYFMSFCCGTVKTG